jgi:hypothetical protein
MWSNAGMMISRREDKKLRDKLSLFNLIIIRKTAIFEP